MTVETGNGASRSPSPTEKHNEPTITANMADDRIRELIARDTFFIDLLTITALHKKSVLSGFAAPM